MGSQLISVAYEVQGLLLECHTFFSIWTLVLSDCHPRVGGGGDGGG